MRDNTLLNSLTYRHIEKEDVKTIIDVWNKEVYKKEIYAELDDFESRFLANPSYKKEGSLICFLGDEFVGCGVACFHKDSAPETSCGFITLIMVKEKYRRHGVGSEILKRLEQYILSSGRTVIRNYFGAPMNLKWYVPGYDKHEHAGAPAVPFNTSYYFLLLANGYNVNGQHDGFHVNLENFEEDEKVKAKIKEKSKPFTITFLGESKLLFYPKESVLVQTLLNAYQEETGDYTSEPKAIGGGTYAKEANNILAFGMEMPGWDSKMHSPGEQVRKADLFKSIAIYAKAIADLGKKLEGRNEN